MRTEHNLRAELDGMRQKNAEVEASLQLQTEQLQGALTREKALHTQNTALQDETHDLVQELDELRSLPSLDPELLVRISEVEAEKSQLESSLREVRRAVKGHVQAIGQHEIAQGQLQQRLDNAESQCNQAIASCNKLQQRKDDFEKEVTTRVNQVRLELVQAADHDKATIQHACGQKLREAQTTTTAMEAKITQIEQDLDLLRESCSREVS
jgi:chromosome segregation ATPase